MHIVLYICDLHALPSVPTLKQDASEENTAAVSHGRRAASGHVVGGAAVRAAAGGVRCRASLCRLWEVHAL